MKLFIIPVAHIHRKSIELVRKIIIKEQPQYIGVELCRTRLMALLRNRKPGMKELLLRPLSGIMYLLQQAIGFMLGISPGAEMKEAILLSRELKKPLLLLDRDINLTLRELERIPLKEKMGIFTFTIQDIGYLSSIDQLMEEKNILRLLGLLRQRFPRLYQIMVEKRDEHIIRVILHNKPESAVIILGAAHLPGILARIRKHNKESEENIDFQVVR
ncbi:TraB/GumN family protein [Candidatus Micrarchaeota archaeon]|nr:TraB/GumN family protein [Candidatus Micrarchaeota archaeon]